MDYTVRMTVRVLKGTRSMEYLQASSHCHAENRTEDTAFSQFLRCPLQRLYARLIFWHIICQGKTMLYTRDMSKTQTCPPSSNTVHTVRSSSTTQKGIPLPHAPRSSQRRPPPDHRVRRRSGSRALRSMVDYQSGTKKMDGFIIDGNLTVCVGDWAKFVSALRAKSRSEQTNWPCLPYRRIRYITYPWPA